MIASIEELISPAFLADVASVPIDQIRAHRTACEGAEVALSYVRRVLQGRLDIANAGDEPGLVDRLPQILAGPASSGGPGRLPSGLLPTSMPSELSAALDDAADVEQVVDLERRVSETRRALHGTIDTLQAELVRRYKSGEANVDSLLG